MPYIEFERLENGYILQSGQSGSDADFVEISVASLFNIVSKLLDNKQIKQIK